MPDLIRVAGQPVDANDGRIGKLDYPIGNKTYGQRIFIAGTEVPLEIVLPRIHWINFETLTVSTTALNFTEGLADLAEVVFLTVEVAPVRYRIDGRAPTATVGHVLEVGDTLRLEGFWEIGQFSVIRRDAADATVFCTFGSRRYE